MSVKDYLNNITSKKCTVGVIGLGYVGLPLLWLFHKKGFQVVGFDIDPHKIEKLNKGIPYIKHLGKSMMQEMADSTRFSATSDFEEFSKADAILICVPTPLDEHREPDMTYIRQTAKIVGKNLKKEQLVVLESTTWPGTTIELMIPILEKHSGLKAGTDFWVAYSPEREDPGNKSFNTESIPKVLGAHTKEALLIADALYSSVVEQTVPVSDTKTAEAVKLTENIFRSVNIALVNELKVIYEKMGIDIHEVLDAADSKPFGFMKFTPGPGLGGHCIPIDPFYLSWKAREHGQPTRFIELAGEINTSMPGYVVSKTIKALNQHNKSVRGSRILIIGIAYKPDVDDMRESPAFPIMDQLKGEGAAIDYYDEYLPVIPSSRDHKEWEGKESISWQEHIISSFDAVVIVTNHSHIDYKKLVQWAGCIIDTRNAVSKFGSRHKWHILKA